MLWQGLIFMILVAIYFLFLLWHWMVTWQCNAKAPSTKYNIKMLFMNCSHWLTDVAHNFPTVCECLLSRAEKVGIILIKHNKTVNEFGLARECIWPSFGDGIFSVLEFGSFSNSHKNALYYIWFAPLNLFFCFSFWPNTCHTKDFPSGPVPEHT